MYKMLLIDADILAYRYAVRNEIKEDFGLGEEFEYVETDIDNAKKEITLFINKLLRDTKCTGYLSFITGKQNFRKELLDSYKGNRDEMVRPALLEDLKQYIMKCHHGHRVDKLEADDLLGLYSRMYDDCVIATIDKDLKMVYDVPVYNWDSGETVKLNQQEALRFHMWQTLVGDKTDNYKGCPYIGPKKADKILDQAEAERAKALRCTEPECVESLAYFYWLYIVDAYEKKGLTEEDALVQARCAYILNDPQDYDFETSEVKLWTS